MTDEHGANGDPIEHGANGERPERTGPVDPSAGEGRTIRAVLFDIGDTLVHAAPPATAVASLQVSPIGDVVDELAELGRHYRLGAVTDTSVMTAADVRRALAGAGIGDRLEVIVSSVDVGATKPDPRGLEAALAALGVTAEEAIFVGDADVDEGAATAAGVVFVRAGGGRSPGPAVVEALARLGAITPDLG